MQITQILKLSVETCDLTRHVREDHAFHRETNDNFSLEPQKTTALCHFLGQREGGLGHLYDRLYQIVIRLSEKVALFQLKCTRRRLRVSDLATSQLGHCQKHDLGLT